MYEGVTYDKLVKGMLDTALAETSTALDTREGSMLWYGVAPAAVELNNLYIQLDWVLDQSFADTATRPYLIRRAAERGMAPYAATPSVIRAKVTPTGFQLPLGSRFSLGEVNFAVTEAEGTDFYQLTCETAGEAGNTLGGNLVPIEYIPGLQSVTVTGLLVPGDDEEETEHFRQRYIESFSSMAYGGNIAQYKEWVAMQDGVGPCRITPVWAGGGSVKVELLDSTGEIPSDELISRVQTALDPTQNHGEGVGLAPIGHTVTVAAPQADEIDLSAGLLAGIDTAAAKANAEAAARQYLLELREKWEDEDAVVRYSGMMAALSGAEGIIDVSNLLINGGTANVSCDGVPVEGTFAFMASEMEV